jgi:hypothetical protein
MIHFKILQSTVMFGLGAASAASWTTLGPLLGRVVRPVLKEVIKTGIILQKEIQTVTQKAWQDVEDLTAEAKAEIDAEKNSADQKDPT